MSSTTRRRFLRHSATAGAALATPGIAGIVRAQTPPGILTGDRPLTPHGMQIGDVLADRAIIWSRADRPARMLVEWSTTPSFQRSTRVRGPHALEVSDYTARVDLTGLPDDRDIFVRVRFENLTSGKTTSDPLVGQLRTAPRKRRELRFLWSGDTAGQGWGINLEWGGMRIYKTMLDADPDFFIHCGDTIYADGPMTDAVTLADGTVWKNAFLAEVPEKRKVAETLAEFRANYRYNLHDANVRAFAARVAQIWQWDDHEVTNNWSDSKELDARYTERNVPTLIGRATRAFLEYAPLRWHAQDEEERVYRKLSYGKELEVFVIDLRSYRGPNTHNTQPVQGDETALLGRVQREWLARELAASRAVWKVIASDMPIGLQVGDGRDAQARARWEAVANGEHGVPSGRELEIAQLLRAIKRKAVKNVVWFTADVHYCAAHHYDPSRAQFQDFEPFWEFVAGPLNAGTFGPNQLDSTFGPKVIFEKGPPAGMANLPPTAGLQFFGQVDIDPRSKDMVVALRDVAGNTLFSQRLQADRCAGWRDDD